MGSSNVLTDLTQAIVRSNVNQMYGQVVSRPALLVTDGKSNTYACDVDVGITQPYPNGTTQQTNDLLGVPGTRNYQVDNSLTVGTILRNVIISNNNSALMYADVGNPVIVERSPSGQWQITGFASEMPGTRMRYPVNLGTMALGPIIDMSVVGRLLTLGELGTIGGGFGICPLGASGIWRGGQLVEIIG